MEISLEIMSQEESNCNKKAEKSYDLIQKYYYVLNQGCPNPIPKGWNPARFTIQQVDNTFTFTLIEITFQILQQMKCNNDCSLSWQVSLATEIPHNHQFSDEL